MRTLISGLKRRYTNFQNFLNYQISSRKKPKRPTVLEFHGIDHKNNSSLNWRFISVESFKFHMDILRKYYDIVSIEEFANENGKSRSTRPVCAITFDDGYSSWYHLLLPVIRQMQIPVTFFITATEKKILWPDLLDIYQKIEKKPIIIDERKFVNQNGKYRSGEISLNEYLKNSAVNQIEQFFDQAQISSEVLSKYSIYWKLLSQSQIKELGQEKLVTLGSHGISHASMTSLTLENARNEMLVSKKILEGMTGHEINAFAFPSGRYNEIMVEAAEKTGYKYLFVEQKNQDFDSVNHKVLSRLGVFNNGNKYTQYSNLQSHLI